MLIIDDKIVSIFKIWKIGLIALSMPYRFKIMNFRKQDSLAQPKGTYNLRDLSIKFICNVIPNLKSFYSFQYSRNLRYFWSTKWRESWEVNFQILELEEPCSSSDSTSLLGFLATKTTVLLANYYKQQFT